MTLSSLAPESIMVISPMARALISASGCTGSWHKTSTSRGSLSSAYVLRDEPIVCGVEHRRMDDAIHLQEPARLVQLVFHVGTQGDRDHRLKIGRVVVRCRIVMACVANRVAFALAEWPVIVPWPDRSRKTE